MGLFLLQHTTFWVFYGLTAWAVGEAFLRGLGRILTGRESSPDGASVFGAPVERAPMALACGLGWIGQGLYFLGMAGLLTGTWMALLLLAMGAASWRAWTALPDLLWPHRPWGLGWGLAVSVLAPLALPALYPPSSFDGGMYHLPFAARFLEAQALVFIPEVRYPIFPQGAEMHFLPAMAWLGDVAAKTTQVWPLLGTAALLLAAGRRLVSARAGWWAAALWLGTPVVVRVGTQAYVDASLAFHVTAAVVAWLCWEEVGREKMCREKASEPEARAWLVLCGLQLGFAASVKYSALFFVLASGAATLWAATLWAASRGGAAGRLRRAVISVLLLAAAFTVVAGPWYGRFAWTTGNPVFPFYTQIFGDNPWRHSHDGPVGEAGDVSSESADAGAGLAMVRDLVRVPWDSWMERGRFHHQAPLSPFFVLWVPWGVWLAAASPLGRRLLFLSLAFGLFWTTTEQDLRILIPILPILSLATASSLEPLADRLRPGAWARSATVAAGLLFLAPGWLFAVYQCAQQGPLPTDAASRTAFLSREVPGFAELEVLRRGHGDDFTVYAFYGEHLRHVCAGRLLGDWFGPDNYERILGAGSDAESLHRELAALEVDFLMIRRPGPDALPARNEIFFKYFEAVEVGPEAAFEVYRLRPSPAQR